MTTDWDSEELEFAPRRAASRCPPPALVLGFKSGELPSDLVPRVAQHVAGCVMCRTLARDLVDLQDAGPALAQKQRVRERLRPPRSRWWLIPAVAAPAAAVIVAALLLSSGLPRRRAAEQRAPVAAVSPPPAMQPAPAIPKAPVMLPVSILVFRGQSDRGGQEAMLQAFGTAVAPYRADRFQEAIARLQEFTKKYPAMPEGFFYLGVSRLLAGQGAEARADLERARRLSPPLRDQVDRYLQLIPR